MRPFIFTKPATADQALIKKTNQAQFIAGGTNLLDLMKKHIALPEELLDVTNALPAAITANTKGIRIDAMVRNSAIASQAEVLSQFPLLAKAVLAGASPQIRNMASTAGNLLQRTRCPYFYDTTVPCNKRIPGTGCSAMDGDNRMSAIVGYSNQCVAVHPSDMCIALAALEANVLVTGRDKKQHSIPFKDFHRLPGTTPQLDNNLPANAVITAVEIPGNRFQKNFAYVKVRDRDSYAFALISVAAALHMEAGVISEARLASGGVAHKPWRWYKAEQFLKGKKPSAENFRQAASIAVGETKPLANNKFKTVMLQGAIETALQNCLTA
ncbi:xanthine dehydrogenase family protein subunit M [Ferruginibacter sp. HRS2-29]|uniref:FAD binding domain-containing protein n=1 Tax=Ferruginibacter sp. HRS2-29 TaxID=2487334 RepID=UPI0020CD0B95|nr:xanthine dehydrogenase family protein subunit M [Ferruginibacter sp. HRS2-29]MCP9750547.1 xanthine dehydrogenase family protein subunit M [Ferruginibacter sp. HRS2-29]